MCRIESNFVSSTNKKNSIRALKNAIDKDLDRTFPTHCLFYDIKSLGQLQLQNLLYAYAVYDPDCGYCQGMGFIGALFLMLMTEEEAFWMLVNLFKTNGKYQLRGLFIDGLPLLHLRFFQFQKMLDRFLPNVSQHLKKLNISPELYSSKWFITIFCYDFPFETSMRIWDCFLSEGIKCVFRFGLALIKEHEKELLHTDFGQALTCLQSVSQVVDTQSILKQAFRICIKHDHLNAAALAFERNKEKKKQLQKQIKKETIRNDNNNKNKQEIEHENDLERIQKENYSLQNLNKEDILDSETGIRKKSIHGLKVKDYMLEEDNIKSIDQHQNE